MATNGSRSKDRKKVISGIDGNTFVLTGTGVAETNVNGKNDGAYKLELSDGIPGYFVIVSDASSENSLRCQIPTIKVVPESDTSITQFDVTLEEYFDIAGWVANPTYTYRTDGTTMIPFYPWMEVVAGRPLRLKCTATGDDCYAIAMLVIS